MPWLGRAQVVTRPLLFVFQTELGNITVEVDVIRAPITGAIILKYINANFYEGGIINRAVRPDNTTCHDVEIQAIQFQSDPARERELFAPIPIEPTSVTGLSHGDCVFSMVRDGSDIAQASFSIVIGDQPGMDFGGKRNPDSQECAVFGWVVDGCDVVKRIHRSHTGPDDNCNTEILDMPIKILQAYWK